MSRFEGQKCEPSGGVLPTWDYSALGPGRMTGTAQSVGGRVGEDDVSEMFGVAPPRWWLSSETFWLLPQRKKTEGKEDDNLQTS